jgi:NAD-dependent SIR2 family protein deacetylase
MVITQNVDRLHQRAGSSRVIDLHGRLDQVICLDCGKTQDREEVQRQLLSLNPQVEITAASATRPDGDTYVPDDWVAALRPPVCRRCQGVIMPDVVFFGGTVPRQRVDTCMQAVDDADLLLALGSSLQVFSGFRFCRRAAESGKPLAIVNPGTTRADDLASIHIQADCGQVLEGLLDELGLAEADGPIAEEFEAG